MASWCSYINKRYLELPTRRIRHTKITGNARYLITGSQKFLNFISNDYLGLSMNPDVMSALILAGKTYGLGSSGAPTLSGYSIEHQMLEDELAGWLGYARCLLFSSGYQLNIGVFSQLVDNNTHVWLDKNCHASHIDGIMLAKAKFSTFNVANIDDVMNKISEQASKRHIVLSEGSFSMDGTCGYWAKLIQLKLSNPDNVLLMIDDAHGVGALGANGYGTLEQLGLDHSCIDLFIGTLGKAFGTHGGFICGNANIINYLQQSVRSQIFSTNLPPCIAAATRKSLAIIRSDKGLALRMRLTENINYFKQLAHAALLNLSNNDINQSAIQLLIFADAEKVTELYNHLLNHNIIVGRIVYPTVPKTKPRLRISLNVQHEKSDIEELINCLTNVWLGG